MKNQRRTKKSVSKRIKLKKSGKILRRAMALGHSRTNKHQIQIKRKKRERSLTMRSSTITKYL